MEIVITRCCGQLVGLFVSAGHVSRATAEDCPSDGALITSVECVAGKGLVGDRYFRKRCGHQGQVTFFQFEVVTEIREKFNLPELSPAVFRRNLIVSGIDLSQLLFKQFQFQGIVFEGTGECKPCVWMDRLAAPGVQMFIRDRFRGGLRARVLTSGILKID